MFIQSKEILLLTMSYLVPGFLITSLIGNTLYLNKQKLSSVTLNYLIFSLINATLFTFVDELFLKVFINPIITNEILIISLRSLLLPLIIWKIAMYFYESDRGRSILLAMGLSKEHLTDTAWDYMFYKMSKKKGAYVIITLKDYQNIYGLFGSKSFASMNLEGNNDIYLENIFENDEFNKSINSGLLLSEKDILAIYYCHTET